MTSAARERASARAHPALHLGAFERVLVRETHISRVFLAGDRAYKLKKPVRFSFLDYRTPARRQRMCQQEVRLNRRLAPDLYLGVRAVIEDEHGLLLADERDPRAVDYVVEMRRYDERSTLAARLARGELRRADVVKVAKVLARFHEQAPPVKTGGYVARLRRTVSENCCELSDMLSGHAEPARLLALESFLSSFLLAHADTLACRARQRLVREVHGDLRAEHVLLDGMVQIVDCVEFDRRLRQIDVADDLAFLVMDLTRIGGERHAQALIDGYRAAGGDSGERGLLAFYAAHRALVRATVELLQARQARSAAAVRGLHSAAARELIALAERFAWRARTPFVLVVCGVPAAGKSELAQTLAASSGMTHLNSDIIRKRLGRLKAHACAPTELYSAEWNKRTYQELGRQASQEAQTHGSVIVDATFRRRADRDAFAETFADSAPAVFIECRAPRRVLLERAARRGHQPGRVSDALTPVVTRERLVWEPLEEVAPEAHVIVRSDRPHDAIVADIMAVLDRRMSSGK
jgi:aminoglycoside phosphotransferase family enzyme/predicted kinase